MKNLLDNKKTVGYSGLWNFENSISSVGNASSASNLGNKAFENIWLQCGARKDYKETYGRSFLIWTFELPGSILEPMFRGFFIKTMSNLFNKNSAESKNSGGDGFIDLLNSFPNKEKRTNPFEIFNFEGKNVRTQKQDNELLFCAKDVCEVLDISWQGNKTLESIPNEWKKFATGETPDSQKNSKARVQQMIFLNSKAIYKLSFRSNKPNADKFVNFVCDILEKLAQGETVKLTNIKPNDALSASIPIAMRQLEQAFIYLINKTEKAIKEIAHITGGDAKSRRELVKNSSEVIQTLRPFFNN